MATGVEVRGATQDELRAHPFWPVIEHVFNGVVAARPDRVGDLATALHGSKMVLVASVSWQCGYCPDNGEIVISTAVIENLWSAALSYYLLYKRVEGSYGGQEGDLLEGTELEAGLEALRWSLDRHFASEKQPWPARAPKPLPPGDGLASLAVASEVTLVALAFIILHEMAHHTLAHQPVGDSAQRIQMERDADNLAADWILGGKGDNEAAREKMRLGIIVACGWSLAVEGIRWKMGHAGTSTVRTHPSAHDRLFGMVDRWSFDPHATTWCFSVAVLQLHMRHIDLPVPRGPFDTCRDAANALVDVLAEHIR